MKVFPLVRNISLSVWHLPAEAGAIKEYLTIRMWKYLREMGRIDNRNQIHSHLRYKRKNWIFAKNNIFYIWKKRDFIEILEIITRKNAMFAAMKYLNEKLLYQFIFFLFG